MTAATMENRIREILLLKCGELVLKGLNRSRFESRLLSNIRYRLRPVGKFKVYSIQSTVYVEPEDTDCDMQRAFSEMSRVFGIASVCRAAVCRKDIADICETAAEYLFAALSDARSFRVSAKRSDKRFPMTSPAIAAETGGFLHDRNPHLKVDLDHPAVVVTVEIRDLFACVHANASPGAGGLPVGTGGRAALLISGGIDSPVAGYMTAKRGVELTLVHFESYPYTSQRARLKVVELSEILSAYAGSLPLHIVSLTDIQETVRDKCPAELFTLITRRFMMRIAARIARGQGLGALVTGESLGQVASQTMESLAVTQDAAGMLVLRPLIGLDKEEIVTLSRRIGAFDTSILPYEDCCTVFTPKHPQTRPQLERVEAAEAALDIETLVSSAISSDTVVTIGPDRRMAPDLSI